MVSFIFSVNKPFPRMVNIAKTRHLVMEDEMSL